MKVEIVRPGASMNLKPFEVGSTHEVSDVLGQAMVQAKVAKPVDADAPEAAKPEDDRETATDPNADERETREVPTSAKAVRQWAADNDVECPSRGAIPASVRAAYDAAMADGENE